MAANIPRKAPVAAEIDEESPESAALAYPSFETIYGCFAKDIYNYICFQTGDPMLADDLASVVFEKV